MSTLQICGFAVVALFCTVVLRQFRPEFGLLLTAAASCAILVCCVTCIYPAISYIRQRTEGMGEAGSCLNVLLRALGIGLLTQNAADLCRDAGESALGGKLELLGKAEITVITLPLFSSLLDTALSFLS